MSAQPIRRTPMTKPATNDPGIDQGRNRWHDPQRNAEIVIAIVLLVVTLAAIGGGLLLLVSFSKSVAGSF